MIFLTDRKLFAYGFLLSMTPMLFLTGKKLFAKGFLLSVAPVVFHTDRNPFPLLTLSLSSPTMKI